MRKILILLMMLAVVRNATAQCSEAENATMKKYAELTRTGDAQACSQCAWLANLFCIAENGLYKNDKSEVQVAINNTKENIKLMGDPICCPELLTKNPTFGAKKSDVAASGTTAPTSKAAQDIDAFISEVNAGINTMNNINAINKSFAELEKDIAAVEQLMVENSEMTDRIYLSEEDVNKEYTTKLANLKKLAAVHLELRTKTQNLGYTASEELMKNQSSRDLGVIVGLGSLLTTDKKDSKAYSANAIDNLNNSKYQQLFKVRYKDTNFSLDLISNKMKELFKKTYPGDHNNFINSSIISGYKVGMKYNEFKKLIPNFKWKYISPGYYRLKDYGNGSDYFFQLGMKKKDYQTVRAIEKKTTYTAVFTPEKLLEYQQIIINEIKYFDSVFNVAPISYSSNNGTNEEVNIFEELNNISSDSLTALMKMANPKLTDAEISNALRLLKAQQKGNSSFGLPVNSVTSVFWSDKANKNFTLKAIINVKNEKITMELNRVEKNLQPIK